MPAMTSALRTLLIVRRLQGLRRGLTVYELAERYDVDPKTIRRTLAVIRKAGFQVREVRRRKFPLREKRYSIPTKGDRR